MLYVKPGGTNELTDIFRNDLQMPSAAHGLRLDCLLYLGLSHGEDPSENLSVKQICSCHSLFYTVSLKRTWRWLNKEKRLLQTLDKMFIFISVVVQYFLASFSS